jgi:hypothetical protein
MSSVAMLGGFFTHRHMRWGLGTGAHAALALTLPCTARRANNVLKHAPHTAEVVMAGDWDRPYSRERAAFPAAWVKQAKFWPSTSRVDNVFGDRKLIARLPEGETRAVAVGE